MCEVKRKDRDADCLCSECVYGTRSYREQKRRAGSISHREAKGLVHGHDDLILGASSAEIDAAVKKIARALRDLRVAKIDAEKAKRLEMVGLGL